jgi:LmbE family N-acetylglucosaminyl deacetylase
MSAGDILQQLLSSPHACASAPVLIIAAHPDDEIIGAGAQLPRWRKAHVIHVTDGAPHDTKDALAAGFKSRSAYAAARQVEAENALALAGISKAQLQRLGVADQQASFQFAAITAALVEALDELRPLAVMTHPYEGGHPDHDATAFAVHTAVAYLEQQRGRAPALLEMTSYHNRAGIMQTGEFLPRPVSPVCTIQLTPQQRQLKQRQFDCFTSQQQVLRWFQLETESFRVAPRYDFTQPPHPGTLYYELFPWGITGPGWRALARKALNDLALEAGAAAPDAPRPIQPCPAQR